jgi:hypothetical protein
VSSVKHTNDQASRRMRGKKGVPSTHRQPPGEPNGMHVLAKPGQPSACNCGGCDHGARIPARVVVLTP